MSSETERSADDPLAHLDFTPTVACDVARQPWTHTKLVTNRWGLQRRVPDPYDKMPYNGPCPNEATHLIEWRVCPCLANPHDWIREHPELHKHGMSPEIVAGLCIVQTSMCEEHLRYFTEYLTYPFACPLCGVAFGSPIEILVSGTSIKKQG